MTAIAVSAWGVHVPGAVGTLDGFIEPACTAENADELLGRKGLLGKEPATRLALCAVHRALALPPGAARRSGPPDPRVAVVGSSNFGNAATVQKLVRAIGRGGLREVSPLDAPNASSNVLSSSVAIWFRFGGPNVMVCSGATSGLDALALGGLLLRSGRAERVVVVGAEPDDEAAASLHRQRAGATSAPLRAAAAALVLERVSDATVDAVCLGPIGRHARVAPAFDAAEVSGVVGPSSSGRGLAPIDLLETIGETSGAAGLLQVALAAWRIRRRPPGERAAVAVVCGDPADGWRSTVLRAAAVLPPAAAIREEVTL